MGLFLEVFGVCSTSYMIYGSINLLYATYYSIMYLFDHGIFSLQDTRMEYGVFGFAFVYFW